MAERRAAEDFAAAVEALAAELAEEFPDPVDVFEDELARELGVWSFGVKHHDSHLERYRDRNAGLGGRGHLVV